MNKLTGEAKATQKRRYANPVVSWYIEYKQERRSIVAIVNKVNYQKFVEENKEILNCAILAEDKDGKGEITIQCDKCGAIHTYKQKHSFYKKVSSLEREFHSELCSRHFNGIIKQDIGEKGLRGFKAKYRGAKERCCNPNSKDYSRYKGKFKFVDYVDFYNHTYNLYKEAVETFGLDNISIDRIDNSKGYEPNNIRFVPMSINLKNKDVVIPVMCVDILTHEIYESDSLTSLWTQYMQEHSKTAMYESIVENRMFKNRYKIFYIPKTQSTIKSFT